MKIEIEVPDDLNQNTAQQCFLLGLKAYTLSNNAGICVINGIERDEDTALMMMSFRGEYAAAILHFCQGVRYLAGNDIEKNLAILRDKGSQILKEMENEQSKSKQSIQ